MFEITFAKNLTKLGFDWPSGEIVIQPCNVDTAIFVSGTEPGHPALHIEYSSFGNSGFPRFIAKDKDAVYVATYADHSLNIERIVYNLDVYREGGKLPATFPSDEVYAPPSAEDQVEIA